MKPMTVRQRARIESYIFAAAKGDRAEFRALYDATSAKLFGIVLRVLKDRDAAEDTLQEAYVKIWRGAARYRSGEASPMTWLITIARNTAIDRLRKRAPATTVPIEDGVDPPDPGMGPEASAVAAGERAALDRCLGELRPERASAVRGAYLDGETYQDLADRHDVPLNTMRTWLRRSLLQLRECLGR